MRQYAIRLIYSVFRISAKIAKEPVNDKSGAALLRPYRNQLGSPRCLASFGKNHPQ